MEEENNVQVVWNLLSEKIPSGSEYYFCWAPGWEKAEILEYWPDKGLNNAWLGGFGNDGGPCREVTHWKLIEYPTIPKEAK